MSQGFTQETAKKLLAFLFKIDSKPQVSPMNQWLKPTRYFIGLGKNQLSHEDTGCTIEEPKDDGEIDNGYKRIDNQIWRYDLENNMVYNGQDIIFPKAKEEWGDIKSVAIMDQMTNGNIIFYKNLENTISVPKDKKVYFKINNLKIKLQSQ